MCFISKQKNNAPPVHYEWVVHLTEHFFEKIYDHAVFCVVFFVSFEIFLKFFKNTFII